MKLLFFVLTFLFMSGEAVNPQPHTASIHLPTGKWIESATEGSVHRHWNGKEWKWKGAPDPKIYFFEESKLVSVKEPGRCPLSYKYKKNLISKRSQGTSRFLKLIYDDEGRVIEQWAPLKENESKLMNRFVYSDNQTDHYDALDHKKSYFWNESHQITRVNFYLNGKLYKKEFYQWSDDTDEALLTKYFIQDVHGKTLIFKEFLYDNQNELTQVRLRGNLTGSGSVDEFVDSIPPGIMAHDLLGKGVVCDYDPNGKIIHQTQPSGYSEAFTWDYFGNLATKVNSRDGQEVKFDYDSMNRIIKDEQNLSYSYDLVSRVAERICKDGKYFSYKYDDLGRIIEISEENSITHFSYNELDHLIKIDNSEIGSICKSYNIRGQPTQIKYPDNTVQINYYKLNGELEKTVYEEAGKGKLNLTDNKVSWQDDEFYELDHDRLDEVTNFPEQALETLSNFQSNVRLWQNWTAQYNGMNWFGQNAEGILTELIGKAQLIQMGYYCPEGVSGVYGNEEIHPQVRVTFNNGIHNILPDFEENLKNLSVSHGDVCVHYIFRPTRGFGWDLMKSAMVKLGYVSEEAEKLVSLWREMIAEMGGTEGNGRIIHYAHSAGGSDTYVALQLLTPSEQKMMDIRTFGSATLIPNNDHYKAINYVSRRDGVCSLDPVRYFYAKFGKADTNIVFIGEHLNGLPFCDHPFSNERYTSVIKLLGETFINNYSQ